MTDLVKTSASEAVLRVTIARPAKKNALNDAMYAALAGAMRDAEADESLRVLLFDAEGDDFCAGNDIADFVALAARGASLGDGNAAAFLAALADGTKPLVAAVRGRAIGIGCTMLLHCDLVYVGESARLSVPFVKLAVVPEAGSSRLLPALLGHVRAFEMFALGRPLSAAEAVQAGIANAAVADADVAGHAFAAARALAALPQDALRATRRLTRDPRAMRELMQLELREFAACMRSPEAQRAFAAFGAR